MEILVAAVVIVILLVLGIGVFIASRREATGLPTDLLEPPGAPPRSGTPTAPPVEEPVVEGPVVVEEPPTFMARLGRARSTLAGYLGSIMSRGVDETTFDELEEALIRADAGAAVASELVAELREVAKANRIDEPAALVGELAALMKSRLDADRSLTTAPGRTDVWLVVGVNGSGKTTTIGKLARARSSEGQKVLLAAGDTFRAAAAEQLATWAERTGSEFMRGAEGADPSSVIFDGIQRAAANGCDLVLADTAGRLHTKVNLMEELAKVHRVASRDPGVVSEVLLVIDATTGQNGLAQARQFAEAVPVTGVVLTKLDGSARGGVVFAIETQLGIPVKLTGLGEGVEDLVAFDPDAFVDALLASD